MLRRAATFVVLAVLGLTMAGCSQCGWIWDDWRSPKSCRSDSLPQK